MSDAQAIVFGQNPNQTQHAFRYIDALGLERDDVTEAILGDLLPRLPLAFPAPSNAPTIGRIIVKGIELRYHAYPINQELGECRQHHESISWVWSADCATKSF